MKISICMASCNGEKYIGDQLESILNQISENDEVIISDDSSIDSTRNIIMSFNDERIVLIENNKFKCPLSNFENAINNATGDIIILSDQDDIWESNKVKVVERSFANKDMSRPVLNLYNGILIDSNNNIVSDDLFAFLKVKKGLISNIIKNRIIGCNIAFNKKLLYFSLPFPKTVGMHDMWLGNIAYLFGEVNFIDNKIIRYRRHSNNFTNYKTTLAQKVFWRYYMVKNLSLRYLRFIMENSILMC